MDIFSTDGVEQASGHFIHTKTAISFEPKRAEEGAQDAMRTRRTETLASGTQNSNREHVTSSESELVVLQPCTTAAPPNGCCHRSSAPTVRAFATVLRL